MGSNSFAFFAGIDSRIALMVSASVLAAVNAVIGSKGTVFGSCLWFVRRGNQSLSLTGATFFMRRANVW